MKKYLFILVAALLLVACGGNSVAKEANNDKAEEQKDVTVSENESEDDEEVKEKEGIEEDENVNKKIDEKLTFAELTIDVEEVNIYEDDGKDLAEINFSWTNQSGDGDKYFFALMSESVEQGGEILEEVSGAYDIENKETNSMHEHNPEGGTVNVKLVYELKDRTTPIEMSFSPLNDFNEEKQVLSIDID